VKQINLLPIDTLFFRDSLPFDTNSESHELAGMFPPFPHTVVGALRGYYARELGWKGDESWKPHICEKLGDRADLGPTDFTGPFLHKNGELLVPMPLNVVGKTEGDSFVPRTLLVPGATVLTDQGKVCLPDFNERKDPKKEPDEVWETTQKHWLQLKDFLKFIEAGNLDHVQHSVSNKKLWRAEPRVGLQRENRKAKEGHLYSATHVRLHQNIGLSMLVKGTPQIIGAHKNMTLGGESRQASLQMTDVAIPLTKTVQTQTSKNACFVALTPLDMGDSLKAGMDLPLGNGQTAKVICVCTEKLQRIGGWNSVARQPEEQVSVYPAGTVIYVSLEGSEVPGFVNLGRRTGFGYGFCAFGYCGKKDESCKQ